MSLLAVPVKKQQHTNNDLHAGTVYLQPVAAVNERISSVILAIATDTDFKHFVSLHPTKAKTQFFFPIGHQLAYK